MFLSNPGTNRQKKNLCEQTTISPKPYIYFCENPRTNPRKKCRANKIWDVCWVVSVVISQTLWSISSGMKWVKFSSSSSSSGNFDSIIIKSINKCFLEDKVLLGQPPHWSLRIVSHPQWDEWIIGSIPSLWMNEWMNLSMLDSWDSFCLGCCWWMNENLILETPFWFWCYFHELKFHAPYSSEARTRPRKYTTTNFRSRRVDCIKALYMHKGFAHA
jgi:hypothetical protein